MFKIEYLVDIGSSDLLECLRGVLAFDTNENTSCRQVSRL